MKMLENPIDRLPIHKRLALAQKCKGCGKMLKNKRKYYLLAEPKIYDGGHWTLVKVCQHKKFRPDGTFTICGTHNYKKKDE
jgi:hypothetical protein